MAGLFLLEAIKRSRHLAIHKDHNYQLTDASDHGVSEAIHLDDPDKIGVELYYLSSILKC